MFIIARLRNFLSATLSMLVLFLLFSSAGSIVEASVDTVPATSAVLVVAGVPGTEVSRVSADGRSIALGTVGASGVLMVSDGLPAGTYVFVFEHKDAVEPLKMEGVVLSAGAGKKLEPQLKMRTGELTVVCLPADVEIFLNGEHKGRGMLVQGNLPVGAEISVEARSSRLGTQTKRIKISAGEPARVDFDLRGNVPATKPDGKIVLPDVPLVLAMQAGALVKVDGVPAKLESGALVELPVGECVAEIFLPLKNRQILVWRGAFVARSAILPGADHVAVAFPTNAKNAETASVAEAQSAAVPAVATSVPVKVAEVAKSAKVATVLGSRFSISSGAKAGLADGGIYDFYFSGREKPLRVRLFGVTPDMAMATPEDRSSAEMPKEGEEFTIEIPKQ